MGLLKQTAGPSPRVFDLEVNLGWAREFAFLTQSYMVLFLLLKEQEVKGLGFSSQAPPMSFACSSECLGRASRAPGDVGAAHPGATEVDAIPAPIL